MTDSTGPTAKTIRWRALALEVAAIFIGITASFVVDEWREEHQDTRTFHRILGEIYYDVRMDESILMGSAAANNASILLASDLLLRDSPMPPGEELFQQLEVIFADNVMTQPTLAGTQRLENTPLSIPVNDVQLSLDNGYGLYLAGLDNIALQMARLRDLRADLWWRAGGVPCTPQITVAVTPEVVEALDLEGQIQPIVDATHEGDRCLPSPENQRAALRAVRDEAFLAGLREIIRIRQNIGVALLSARATAHRLRGTLETYLPDIHLPVQTIGIVGDATAAAWDPALAVEMRRVTTHVWEAETRLSDGEVKFAANREWTMSWGAPRPWVARGPYMSFDEGVVDRSEVFPTGTASFNGINIPVDAGRYRVRFNTRSGAYSFDRLSD
jgi:hypothetical protein